jgi:hypothetical protein
VIEYSGGSKKYIKGCGIVATMVLYCLLHVKSQKPLSFNSAIQHLYFGQASVIIRGVLSVCNACSGVGHVRNITGAIILLKLISILEPNPHMACLANEKM